MFADDRTTDLRVLRKTHVTTIPPCRIVHSLAELVAEQPAFGCVYADPPWTFDNTASRAAADKHYQTMTLAEIKQLPVHDLAAQDSHLHLWVPSALLADGLRVVTAWGFEYKTCFVWIKPQLGMGNYWRSAHEVMLLGVRGSAPFRRRDARSWLLARRGQHSTKPDKIRELVESVSPGPYLELFGRRTTPGWTVFGNDVRRMLF